MAYALEAQVLRRKEVPVSAGIGALAVCSHSAQPGERKSLYVTCGALFTGLLGVFLFAAPGGIAGALLGAAFGAAAARLKPGAPGE